MRGKKNFELTPKSLLVIFTAVCALLLAISAAAGGKQTPLSNITSSVIMPMRRELMESVIGSLINSVHLIISGIYRQRMKSFPGRSVS